MPRKKRSVRAVKVARKPRQKKSQSVLERIKANMSGTKWTESYSSFLLGVVVVIIAVLFTVSVIRQQHPLQQTTSLSTGPTPTVTASPTPGTTLFENGKTYYIVKPDDSLWTIALSVYNDGYKWTEVAKANNLSDPSTIFTGDKLLLPNAPSPNELGGLIQKNTNQAASNAITAKSYTVQKGDSLWDIAVRAYADGYQWPKIAEVNHLTNPDLIFSGNILILPR